MPILLGVGVFIMANIKKYTTLSQDVYAHAGRVVEQAISGIRTVYSFSLQARFSEIYNQRLEGAERCDAKRGVIFGFGAGTFFFSLYSIYGISTEFFNSKYKDAYFFLALAFWYGSKLVINRELTGADVMVVFFAMLMGAMVCLYVFFYMLLCIYKLIGPDSSANVNAVSGPGSCCSL